jgi:hypothetical protein
LDIITTYEKELNSNTIKYKSICEDFADAKQIYERMDDLKKTKLAQCKLKYEGSDANRETHGRADNDYIGYLSDLAKTRKLFYDIQMKKEAYINRIDALKTMLATQRELAKLR